MRLFQKKNGIISIMLVIVLVPVLMTSTVLVEMIRFRSSSQLLDMAVMSAAISTLADYNQELYKKYGLLAVEGEQDSETAGWIAANINSSGNVFNRIVDPANLTVSVEELYALDNVDVLQRQIMEAEKYQGPFNFIEGTVGVVTADSVDDLFKELSKQIEKAIPGFDVFKQSTEVMNTAGEAANQCIELYEKYEEWQNAVSAYETAHSDYINAYNDALSAHSKAYPEGSENEDALDYKHTSIREAEQKYIEAINNLGSKGTEMYEAAAEVVSKCAETVSDIGSLDVKKQQNENSAQAQKQKDAVNSDPSLTAEQKKELIKEIDQWSLKDNAAAAALASQSNLAAGVENTLTGFSSDIAKAVLNANVEVLVKQVQDFDECGGLLESREVTISKKEIKIVDGKPAVVETSATETRYFATDSLASDAYFSDMETMMGDGLNYVKSAIEHLNEDYAEEDLELFAYFDVMKYVISFITGDGMMLSDSIANNVLVEDVPETSGGFGGGLGGGGFRDSAEYGFILPGKSMSASVTDYTTGDEDAVTALLTQLQAVRDVMEYDVDSMYPDNRRAVAQKDVEVERAINAAITALTIIGDYISSISRALKGSILDILKIIRDFTTCFQAVSSLVENLIFLADNVQSMFENLMEMVYQGVMINGYVLNHFTSRADIEPYNRAVEALAPIEHTSFKYAQAEYVIAGKMAEADNQRNVTLSLYFLRFLLNIPTVVTDSNIVKLASKAGYFAPVVLIIFVAIETVLDVIALQGIDARIPIVKSHPFLSGDTLKNMADNLKNTVKDKAQKPLSSIQLGTDVESVVNTLENDIIQPIVKSMFEKDLFKMNYEDYLWVRMCLVSNETKVRRIADLIYMEMYQKDKGFLLSRQYTYLRVEAEAKYTTVMPLYDVLGATEVNSVKYCGY